MKTKTEEALEFIVNEEQIKILEEKLSNMTQQQRVERVREARSVLEPVMEYCMKQWSNNPHDFLYNVGVQGYIEKDWFLIFFDVKNRRFVVKKYEKGVCPPFVQIGWFGKRQYANEVLGKFSDDIFKYLQYYPWSPNFIYGNQFPNA